jgi:hypothetical protein
MVVFKNKKSGYKYETKTTVDKVPSSGKYRVHGYIEVTYPNGKYEIVNKQTLTFDMRKDADKFAAQLRKNFTAKAKQYAK